MSLSAGVWIEGEVRYAGLQSRVRLRTAPVLKERAPGIVRRSYPEEDPPPPPPPPPHRPSLTRRTTLPARRWVDRRSEDLKELSVRIGENTIDSVTPYGRLRDIMKKVEL